MDARVTVQKIIGRLFVLTVGICLWPVDPSFSQQTTSAPLSHPFDLQGRAALGLRSVVSIADPNRGYPDPPPVPITQFSTEMDGKSGAWIVEEGVTADFSSVPGHARLRLNQPGQFGGLRLISGMSLDQIPPPWEMEICFDLPESTDSFAIGFVAAGPGTWQTLRAFLNPPGKHIINTIGGLADHQPDWGLPVSVTRSDPFYLLIRVLDPSHLQLGAKASPAENWTLLPVDTVSPLSGFGTWRIMIEERPAWYYAFGGQPPLAPRTYGIDYIRFRDLRPDVASQTDPLQFRGLPYFHTRFNEAPVSMYHLGADYSVMLGNNVDGGLLAQLMTGDLTHHSGLAQQIGMMKAFVRGGFAMSNFPLWCPDADPAGESSTLMALLTLHMLGDVEALPKALEMAAAHLAVAQREGAYAYWPGQWCAKDQKWYPGYVSTAPETPNQNGWAGFGGMFIQPLAYLIEMTNDPKARQLAVGLARYLIEVASDFDPNALIQPGTTTAGWSYRDHFLSRIQTIAGILKLGQVLNDSTFKAWARKAYIANRDQYVSRFGFSPENVRTRRRSEAWALNELIACAALLASGGEPEFWDDVERYAMNHLLENQMTRATWRVPASLMHGADDLNGFDYTRENVMDRMVGAFAGFGRVNDFTDGQMNQNDGNGRPLRALYTVWYYASRFEQERLAVNLWFSKRLPQAEITSYLPGNNKLEIRLAEARRVQVRRPAWATPDEVAVTVDGRPIPWQSQGVWIDLPQQPAQSVIVVSLPDRLTSTHEAWDGQNLTIQWRGNAVISMQPTGTYQPYYQNRSLFGPGRPSNFMATIDLDPLHYAPRLSFRQTGDQLTLSGASAAFILQENSLVPNPAGWMAVPGGTQSPAQVKIGTEGRFFRLKQ